jgi:esterase/lipase superfamily enzyme
MVNALQQMALVDALLTNWDAIRLRMGPLSPELAASFTKLGQELADAKSLSEAARIVSDLLDLTRNTPAESYTRELVARASLGEMKTTRGPGTLQAVNTNLEALIETPIRAQESTASLGTLLSQTSALPIGVQAAPVFFATNRKPGGPSGTTFSGDVNDSLSFGLATVTIPVPTHEIGKLETPKWWKLYAKDQRESFLLNDVSSLNQTEFGTKLEAAAQVSDSREILIFLHGFNVTFEEAALRAAQFAYDSRFRGIVVLFSWPSQGSVLGYSGDEDRALASGEKMAGFLRSLENGPWPKVHLLAHSMGNRVMLSGLADNPRPKLALGQLVFAAADVYVPVFNEKFPKLQTAGKLASTSYASKKDRALWLSSVLHSGARVGIVEDIPYVTDGLESIDASSVDKGMLGHGYWSDQRTLITDLRSLLQQGLSPKDRGLDQIGKYWAFPK